MTRLTCVLAVSGLRTSCSAISALVRPGADEREDLELARGELLEPAPHLGARLVQRGEALEEAIA